MEERDRTQEWQADPRVSAGRPHVLGRGASQDLEPPPLRIEQLPSNHTAKEPWPPSGWGEALVRRVDHRMEKVVLSVKEVRRHGEGRGSGRVLYEAGAWVGRAPGIPSWLACVDPHR